MNATEFRIRARAYTRETVVDVGGVPIHVWPIRRNDGSYTIRFTPYAKTVREAATSRRFAMGTSTWSWTLEEWARVRVELGVPS